jgi:hypothetical protein
MRGKATWLILVAVGAVVTAGFIDAVRGSSSNPEQPRLAVRGRTFSHDGSPYRPATNPWLRPNLRLSRPVDATVTAVRSAAHELAFLRHRTTPAHLHGLGGLGGGRASSRERAALWRGLIGFKFEISPVTAVPSSAEIRVQLGQPISRPDRAAPRSPMSCDRRSFSWSQQSPYCSTPVARRGLPATRLAIRTFVPKCSPPEMVTDNVADSAQSAAKQSRALASLSRGGEQREVCRITSRPSPALASLSRRGLPAPPQTVGGLDGLPVARLLGRKP